MDGRVRLAWNVRRLRIARGMTQETLALDAAVAAPYLSRIEQGKVNPTIDVMDRLAVAFGVTVDELLKAPGPMSDLAELKRTGRKLNPIEGAGRPKPRR